MNIQEPTIKILPEKTLVGLQMNMSFVNNKTQRLWQKFMPRRKEIKQRIGENLYAIQSYPPSFFEAFDPNIIFEKWAAVEVEHTENIPEGMKKCMLKSGLYAIFQYKGLPSNAAPFFQYILGTWLPNSAYTLDNRPHFEILGAAYKNNHPDSEEEIWIPIRIK